MMVRKKEVVVILGLLSIFLDVSAAKSDDFADFRRRMTPSKTRVYNQNQQIKKWPNNKVYFYIDPGYTVQEVQLIRMSILRVVSDIQNCVIFVEVPPSDPRYKVKITPFQNDSVTPESFCYTYPGVYAAGRASGALEQRAVLARGKNGCLDDGSIHRVMKFFGLLLGLRNVHQRPDRDDFIEIQPSNVLPGMLDFGYRKYSTEEALMVCPYDYCSITHNIEADFAGSGPAFTVKQPPFFIPQLDRLSECDCQEISAGYGCDTRECSPLDCAAQVRPVAPPAVTQQPPTPVAFSTQSSLTSVITSVTSSDKETTICYSVPNTQAPTEFSVKTTPSPTTLDRDSSRTTCSIIAGAYKVRRKPRMGREHFRVINADPKYHKWSDNAVPYYIDKAYTNAERDIIEDAIDTVTGNMKGCVEFVEVQASSDEYKLKITPFAPDGKTQEKQCSTYPGVYTDHVKKSINEQAMVLARGPDGCLGGTHHNILKYFAIALGKRTEHQRPDRDDFIQIVSSGITDGMAFAYDRYDWGITKNKHAYDLCSVTHNQQTVFAKPGQVAFTVKNPPYRVPMLNRFSEMDCRELSEEYGCDANKCDPLKCEEQILTSTTGTTTVPSTSETTSSMASTTVSPTTSPSPQTTTASPTSSVTPSTRATTRATSSLTVTTLSISSPITTSSFLVTSSSEVPTSSRTSSSTSTPLSPSSSSGSTEPMGTSAARTSTSNTPISQTPKTEGQGTQCTTTFSPPTTTPMSVNPCSLQVFCTKGPQESVGYFAAGYDKLLMFRGACALEYTVDYEHSKILPTSRIPNPQPTSQFFTGSKSSLLTNVDQAYVQVNVTDNSGNFQPQMVLISNNVAVLCVGLMPAVCETVLPKPAQGSSYSTWTNNGVDLEKRILYFVVNADGKSIVMSDGDKTYPATTVDVVASQSTITTITALQVIDDDFLGTGSYLGVFGTDAAGAPYFGLGSLSSSPIFGDNDKTEIRWLDTPQFKKLFEVIQGC